MRQVSLSHGIVSSTLQSHWAATDMQVVVGIWPKLEPLRCCEETRARNRSLVYQRGCWGTGTSGHSPGCSTVFVRSHYISNAVTDNYKQPVAGNRFYGWLTVANRYFAKSKLTHFGSTVIQDVANHSKENLGFALATPISLILLNREPPCSFDPFLYNYPSSTKMYCWSLHRNRPPPPTSHGNELIESGYASFPQ